MKFNSWVTVGIAWPILMMGCDNYWDEHYSTPSETVNENVWEAVQMQADLSLYVQYMKKFNYDTLFLTNDSYSLFIPVNEAFDEVLDTGDVNRAILDYHLSLHFIQSGSVNGLRKIQTYGEKFAVFENTGNSSSYDGIPLDFESPLYLNGKYFTMKKVAYPKPNLYEFFAINNPILKDYIDSQDSLIIDKEKSRPKGFDSLGNTIYDTVAEIYNIFEAEFFPVTEEFRNKKATIVFPLKDDYHAALTEMALKLGGNYIDYNDIPLLWQNEVLIPHLLEHGVFQNQLEEYEFMFRPGKDSIKLKNIQGDSIVVTYSPKDKTVCSNGYAYNYTDFSIPDSLYIGSAKTEGEWLLRSVGLDKYQWYEDVVHIEDITWEPDKQYIEGASNDSVLYIAFSKGYTGKFILEFRTENMFPGNYHMVVRTHMDVGGIYDIYVNDEFVMTIDYNDFALNRGIWWSCAGGRYFPDGSFNKFDACDVVVQDFGKTRIRFEYTAPGAVKNNGLVIDYVEFTPME